MILNPEEGDKTYVDFVSDKFSVFNPFSRFCISLIDLDISLLNFNFFNDTLLFLSAILKRDTP